MIRKIVVLTNYSSSEYNFIKLNGGLRLSYMLRSIGYEVKQIHNCLLFTPDQLCNIIDDFSGGDKVLVCISTSFLPDQRDTENAPWGKKVHDFLHELTHQLHDDGRNICMGGWFVTHDLSAFSDFKCDFYSIGSRINIIDDFCNELKVPFVSESSAITDFSDCSSAPLIEDNVNQGESLSTELAAGCIFSCSFCSYGALGKKKHEYTRTYESFEREIISNWNNFHTRVYTLTDNIVNDSEEKIKFLVKVREKTGIDLRWVGYIRLDTINPKQLSLLKDSGIAGAVMGIESLKTETGRYIGKLTQKARIIKLLESFRSSLSDDVVVMGTFIAGLPTETSMEILETYKWLIGDGRDLIDTYRFSALSIFNDNHLKNQINTGRGNPFKDYDVISEKNWKSPWGSYEHFSKLSNEITSKTTGVFGLPFIHNLGIELEDAIKTIRNKRSIIIPQKNLIETRSNYINRILA